MEDWDLPAKPAESALRRWRQAALVVNNRRRRFRYVSNLEKREEIKALIHKDRECREVYGLVEKKVALDDNVLSISRSQGPAAAHVHNAQLHDNDLKDKKTVSSDMRKRLRDVTTKFSGLQEDSPVNALLLLEERAIPLYSDSWEDGYKKVESFCKGFDFYHDAQLQECCVTSTTLNEDIHKLSNFCKRRHSGLANAAELMTVCIPDPVSMALRKLDSVQPEDTKIGEAPLRSEASIDTATPCQVHVTGFPSCNGLSSYCSSEGTNFLTSLAGYECSESLFKTLPGEQDLKDRYTSAESKEKEILTQLEAIRKEKHEIDKKRRKIINQTKHLVALAEEAELQMKTAAEGLIILEKHWASVQSSFV